MKVKCTTDGIRRLIDAWREERQTTTFEYLQRVRQQLCEPDTRTERPEPPEEPALFSLCEQGLAREARWHAALGGALPEVPWGGWGAREGRSPLALRDKFVSTNIYIDAEGSPEWDSPGSARTPALLLRTPKRSGRATPGRALGGLLSASSLSLGPIEGGLGALAEGLPFGAPLGVPLGAPLGGPLGASMGPPLVPLGAPLGAPPGVPPSRESADFVQLPAEDWYGGARTVRVPERAAPAAPTRDSETATPTKARAKHRGRARMRRTERERQEMRGWRPSAGVSIPGVPKKRRALEKGGTETYEKRCSLRLSSKKQR